VGNQAPLKEVERPLFRFVVLPIDEQLLARGSIVSPWDIAQPAIADIEALDNGEAKRPGTLDNATTHRAISRLARVRSPPRVHHNAGSIADRFTAASNAVDLATLS
jgi:hypothetical protein